MDFYETYSAEFSKSRYKVWPQVRAFVDALPIGAKVLEIGCGNGKNMCVRKDLIFIGIEPSAALCDTCTTRGLNVVQADASTLPFRDGSFDAVIMIAVLHHISPNLQYKAMFEIQRVLKPYGKALITNWAVEQPLASRRKFIPGLNYVIWKGKEESPLRYWVMNKAMTIDFICKLPHHLNCKECELISGNWSFIFEKVLP